MVKDKNIKYTDPEEVKASVSQKVLTYLNSARSTEELASAIEVPDGRDLGLKVARKLLAKRTQLGGFNNLNQVAAILHVGSEKFTKVVNTLASKKETRSSYVIEGQLKSGTKLDFRQTKLVIYAFIGGVEVAKASVNAQGKYRLTFEHAESPSATELRILPEKFARRVTTTTSLAKTISATRYAWKKQEKIYHAVFDPMIPSDFVLVLKTVTKTYHMHGVVYATTFSGGMPISIEPLPAAKIEFYEVDAPIVLIPGEDPVYTDAYLGYAYTTPDGSYDFQFDFSYRMPFTVWQSLFTDKIPDIRARISQFNSGVWQQVYEGPVDWDISEDFHRDYFVPEEDTIPPPPGSVKPDEGLRFISLGLLPIDTDHIKLGYATAQPTDPARIASISHQPFCGTLRIFGLFAESPPVATYKVQIAVADETGPIGDWDDVTDVLYNRKWNSGLHKWDGMNLGPDPATGKYQNIDTEPEPDWLEHSLKVTWNTANYPNGYYALRIIGYDISDIEVGPFKMPVVVRIDNSVPEAALEIIGTSVGEVNPCGALQLGRDRDIDLKVTAYDPEGHVLKYWLAGTRGKDDLSAGTTLYEERPDPTSSWEGVEDEQKTFHVAPLQASLGGCTTLAYDFELHVWGLATDGYNVTPGTQRVVVESNLIVSEPRSEE